MSLQLQADFASYLGSLEVMFRVVTNMLAEAASAASVPVSRLSFVSLSSDGMLVFHILPGGANTPCTNEVGVSLLSSVRLQLAFVVIVSVRLIA